MSGSARVYQGDSVRIVEHDGSTREPVPGGRVLLAEVTGAGSIYAHVRYSDLAAEWTGRETDTFYQESGWRSWDGEFRWRLMAES